MFIVKNEHPKDMFHDEDARSSQMQAIKITTRTL